MPMDDEKADKAKENPIPEGYDPELVRYARELRAAGHSTAEIAQLLDRSWTWAKRAVHGQPVPESLRRRYAKDGERERSRELRAGGMPPKAIAAALGVSLGTVYRWTGDLLPMTVGRERQLAAAARKSARVDDELRPRVLELRRAGATIAELESSFHLSAERLQRILGDEPVPLVVLRRHAKDELRVQARELRSAGQSMPDIARQLDVAKSTVFEWTRDLPVPERFKIRGFSATARAARSQYWAEEVARREQQRGGQIRSGFDAVDGLSDRELLLVGAALYWAEGSKSKPWRRAERIIFVNSDPSVIRLFMSWLRLNGVPDDDVKPRLQIHETADVREAMLFWASVVGIPAWRSGSRQSSDTIHEPIARTATTASTAAA